MQHASVKFLLMADSRMDGRKLDLNFVNLLSVLGNRKMDTKLYDYTAKCFFANVCAALSISVHLLIYNGAEFLARKLQTETCNIDDGGGGGKRLLFFFVFVPD